MNCLIYCPSSYLREYWDYYLREQNNVIFHYFNNDFDILDNLQFDRVIFCQEHDYLSFKLKDKNIHTIYAGKKLTLKQEYDAVYFWQDIKVFIDHAFQNNEIPSHFNASPMSRIMPVLFQAINKKTTGLHQIADPDIYLSEDIIKFYQLANNTKIIDSKILKSSQECTENINFKRERKLVNIYIPTYYRLKKTKRSIESIINSANKSKYDIAIYIGDNNTKLEDMKSWLQSLARSGKVHVLFSTENKGKASMINLLHSQARKCDYIFNIDSDMVVEEQKYHPFDRMIDCLERCDNVGLVSSNQKDCNQHWFTRGVIQYQERGFSVGYSADWVGVAGGCIVLRSEDWEAIGGYKENHDIYTGDDGILTYNISRKLGKRVLVCCDADLLHPKPGEDEKGYNEWKAKSWQRDKLNFIKDNYTGSNKKGYYD